MRVAALILALAACSGGSDGGSGAVCGGFAGAQCAADEFCDFPNDGCGAADDTGSCRARPDSCDSVLAPVCGCDGKVYDNLCVANREGVDANVHGTCQMP